MITGKHVELTYSNGVTGLQASDFHIGQGELVYIVGPSGSGKTSLIKLIMGSEVPTGGELTVLGQLIKKGKFKHIQTMRQSIGPVFQEFRLIQGQTALENVMMSLRFIKNKPKDMTDAAKEALMKVGLLDKANRYIDELSWGECQRVAIARAVVRKPALILADEPTGNLDKENAELILALLAGLRNEGTSVVLTTHATHLIENQKNVTFIRMSQGSMTIERR
jgi:cell division transport system ATP-binding protein